MLNKLISFVKKNKALDVVTNSTDPTSFFTNLVEVYKEGKRTELEIEQLRLKKEVLLTEIEKNMIFIIKYLLKFLLREEWLFRNILKL